MQQLKRFFRLYKTEAIYVTVILIAILLAFTVIFPQTRALFRRYRLMKETETNIEKLKGKQVLLDSYDQAELEATYRIVVATIPRDKILGTLMSGIDTLLSQYEVSLLSFAFDSVGSVGTGSAARKDKKETNIYSTIPITMTVEGTLPNIRNFLDSANRTRPLYLIKNFDLAFSSKDNIFRSKIAMDATYMPLPKTLGTVMSTLTSLTADEESLLTKISSFSELVPVIDTPNTQSAGTLPMTPAKPDPFQP